MNEPRSKKFIYRNTVRKQDNGKGILIAAEKPDIEVASPPEFGGPGGTWSPEDLLVASVNACIMTTFLFFAKKDNIPVSFYESEAEEILEKVDGIVVPGGFGSRGIEGKIAAAGWARKRKVPRPPVREPEIFKQKCWIYSEEYNLLLKPPKRRHVFYISVERDDLFHKVLHTVSYQPIGQHLRPKSSFPPDFQPAQLHHLFLSRESL